MDILVIGGTRYMGVHLVKNLLDSGHNVTIATRGQTPDKFSSNVERIIIDRTNANSIAAALKGKRYDVAYDSLAYSSNEIRCLLDVLRCERYIETSTLSVYPEFKMSLTENDFNPLTYPLKWCVRNDFSYDEVKRQAECALFQKYSDLPAVAVRFPFVIGEDDYTKRLYFYVEHIVKSLPFYADNLNEQMAFVKSSEAGKFLAFLSDSDFCGTINAASYGTISLAEIIDYVQEKVHIKAVIIKAAEAAPYNGTLSYSLDLYKAEKIGYEFSNLKTWIYDLLDFYIDVAKRNQMKI